MSITKNDFSNKQYIDQTCYLVVIAKPLSIDPR